ncbi:MAG: sugar-transfer associated ATP-grasp domain-containing protein [Paludibacteraceae bacterium]
MKHNYIGETSVWKTTWYVIDFLWCALVYGASISDYFAYGFYKLRPSGKNEYITYRRFFRMMKKANSEQDIHLCRNKIDFNNYFSDLLGREWLDIKTATMDEIRAFAEKHPVFFAKEIMGFRGDGVKRIDSKKINLQDYVSDLQKTPGAHYILEEPLTEIASIQEFHPWSINTIRVVTFYDTKNDTVHFMNVCMRLGNNHNNVDNFHYDGIGTNVDVETGVINSCGYDKHNNYYISHPLSHKQIIGFQVPYWTECREYLTKAARRLPTVRYIGWDVVIQENGTICLIEANDNADHDIQQLHNKGLWKEYQSLIKNLN